MHTVYVCRSQDKSNSKSIAESGSLALVKAALPVPLLIVKPDSLGQLTNTLGTSKAGGWGGGEVGEIAHGGPGALKAVVEVGPRQW